VLEQIDIVFFDTIETVKLLKALLNCTKGLFEPLQMPRILVTKNFCMLDPSKEEFEMQREVSS